MRREALLALIKNEKTPEPLKVRARRQLEELDAAEAPKPKAAEAEAPKPVPVPGRGVPVQAIRPPASETPRSFPGAQLSDADWLSKVKDQARREREEREKQEIAAQTLAEDVAALEQAEGKPVVVDVSDETKTRLRTEGRDLMQAWRVQETRCWKSYEQNLAAPNPRPDRAEELALRGVFLKICKWYGHALPAGVAKETEFQNFLKEVHSYARQEVKAQAAAARVTPMVDVITAPQEAPKKKPAYQDYDPARLYQI